ncbi:hypothetical protein [Absidia glauca]|uniref:Ndc10 domain-containing protein n=1 Tax=Absidia glauca TaxID=4829 RepID=A0A168LI10_ABSGL|nr:hypothetical protein [Absidia glauca]
MPNNASLCAPDFKPQFRYTQGYFYFCPSFTFARGGVVVKAAPGGREDRGSESHNPIRLDFPRQLLSKVLLFKV